MPDRQTHVQYCVDLNPPDYPQGGVATDESVDEEAHWRTDRTTDHFVYMVQSVKNFHSAMQATLTDWCFSVTQECFQRIPSKIFWESPVCFFYKGVVIASVVR